MKVLRLCGDGKNAFSENICQTWLSQENVKAILENDSVPVFVLCYLMEFYYHIFLDIEKEITSYQTHFLHQIIRNLTNHLTRLSSKLAFHDPELLRFVFILDGPPIRYMDLYIQYINNLVQS